MRALLLAPLILLGCSGKQDGKAPAGALVDGPKLVHVQPRGALYQGENLTLEVTATDPDGISLVEMSYRRFEALAWEAVELEVGNNDVYSATIPGADIEKPGVEYYFTALDNAQLTGSTILPDRGFDKPFFLEVQARAERVPWFEDFEDADSSFSLYDLGWEEVAEGFPGAAWTLTDQRAYSGSWAAYHGTGSGDRDLKDWLVSPPLDFSKVDTAQVTWWQTTVDTPSAPPKTLLFASTGSSDPESGDFERVASTDVPVGWERSDLVDLSDYAGEPRVFLAWKYDGKGLGWHIDDIDVRELGADLHLIDFQHAPVNPGGTTEMDITLENRSSRGTDGPVTVRCDVDPAFGSCSAPESVGRIGAGNTAMLDLALTVDATYPDNSLLPLEIVAEDAFQEWRWPVTVLVGDPSAATVTVRVDDDTSPLVLVQMSLGAGDPASPTTEIQFVSELLPEASDYTFDIDLNSHTALLPPSADNRWWLRTANSNPGSLLAFTITWDGNTYSTTDLAPWDVAPNETLYYLPQKVEVRFDSVTSTPTPLAPGATGQVQLVITNTGGDTSGMTTAVVTSDHPDVTVTSTAPTTLSSTGWMSNDTGTIDVDIDVDAAHTDSTPIRLLVTLTDDYESYDFYVELPVPWPVLVATQVALDDFVGGNNDQVLQSGEDAFLDIALTNSGGLDTWGTVRCSVRQDGGAAVASFPPSQVDVWGFLGVGTTKRENDLELHVDSGNNGDLLDLVLDCTDDQTTYEVPVPIELGLPSWQVVSNTPDAVFDPVDDYPFDARWAYYRAVGDELQLKLVSRTPYDQNQLFFEFWADSPGGQYDYYRMGSQSGQPWMDAWSGITRQWTTLTPYPTVSYPDAYSVVLHLPVPAMGLAVDELSVGVGIGFCPQTYFCDEYPDAWTPNPYQSITTSLWYPIRW